MPSIKNCNVPNSQRRVSHRQKIQKHKSSAGISKNPRGTAASSVIAPTKGPLAPPSGKKARKIERARNHAKQRAVEEELAQEEEAMTDAPQSKKSKKSADAGDSTEEMKVDDA